MLDKYGGILLDVKCRTYIVKTCKVGIALKIAILHLRQLTIRARPGLILFRKTRKRVYYKKFVIIKLMATRE